eukprot:69784-Prorocentrum_minimum.AAC.1
MADTCQQRKRAHGQPLRPLKELPLHACRSMAGAWARSGSQSREDGGHMPGAGANRARVKGICLEREPIARGWRAYARSGSQSRE